MACPIVEIPGSVRAYCESFRGLFANEPQFLHFQRYVTGLIVSENVTVEGINTLFPEGTDPSNLNRFLTAAPWSAEELNTRRLKLLQKDFRTKWGKRGVVAIDDTLNRHEGKHFDLIEKIYDSTEQDFPLAHCLVTSHYVGPNVQYPIEYRLFIQAAAAERAQVPFKGRLDLAAELIHDTERRGCPAETYAFDTIYTRPQIAKVVESYGKSWAGSLQKNRLLTVANREVNAEDFARELPADAYRKVVLGEKAYWVFSKVVRVSHFDERLRVVISFDNPRREGDPKILVTNALHWEALRVMRAYECRWSVETFHKILKSGCRTEDLRLRTAQRLANVLAVHCILAWRIFWMSMVSRSAPTAPAALAFTDTELRLLDRLVPTPNRPLIRKPISRYVTKLAQLGGYLARRWDPPPGNMVIWRGLCRLTDIELGFALGAEDVGN